MSQRYRIDRFIRGRLQTLISESLSTHLLVFSSAGEHIPMTPIEFWPTTEYAKGIARLRPRGTTTVVVIEQSAVTT
jgi:hypothetical protein